MVVPDLDRDATEAPPGKEKGFAMRKSIAAAMAAVLTCALAPAAGAAVLTPTSGWFWSDPQPQGDRINELRFAGSRGYAIGAHGTALRTDDGGATWAGLHTGLAGPLQELSVPTPDTILFGGGCVARRSTDGGATFQPLRFAASETRCRASLAELSFISADQGYVVTADGAVQFTQDGGRTFAGRTPVPGTVAASGTASPSELVALSASTLYAATTAGELYRSTDGGSSWNLHARVGDPLRELTFVGPSTVYAVASTGAGIWRSNDGGVTWNIRLGVGPGNGRPAGLTCVDASTCAVVVSGQPTVVRTSDGWTTVHETVSSGQGLYAAAFAGASRLVVAGFGGVTRVSDDAGATFAPVGAATDLGVTRLRPGPGSLVYAPADDGRIGITGDGGRSWSSIAANTPDRIVDVAFPTASRGYALDSTGQLLKTVNGGASWAQLDAGAQGAAALVATSTTNVVLLGRGIWRSTDGERFARVAGVAGRRTFRDVERVGGALFAWGGRNLFVSTDRGRTWAPVRRPGPRLTMRDVDFVTPTRGFLLDTAGRLYRTSDRGRHWSEIVSLGNPLAERLSFHDARSGYVTVLGPDLVVMRTTDGGRTFVPQLVDACAHRSSGLLATGPATALLASAGTALVVSADSQTEACPRSLFATTTGGQAGTASTISLSPGPRAPIRPGNVTIRGRLRPARGGETVTMARFDLRRGRWETRELPVASNGGFSSTWHVTHSSAFVTSWRGDDRRAGDGSPPLTVKVGRR